LARENDKVFSYSARRIDANYTDAGIHVSQTSPAAVKPDLASSANTDLSRSQRIKFAEPGITAGELGVYFVTVVVSLLVAVVLYETDGNIEAGMALVAALAIIFISFYRIDLAFFVLIGMVLLFDQFIVVPGGEPLTTSVRYFDNLKQMPFFPSFSEGVMNPIEVQIALMLFGWFLAISAKKNVQVQKVPFSGLGLLLVLALVGSLGHGLGTGGDFLPSLWEVRALFYFILLYFLVPQIIQTREQISVLIWILIIVVAIKDLQGGLRFAELGFSFRGNLCLTNHEDPVFTVDLIMLLIAFSMFGSKAKQRTAILLLLFPMLLGFYAGNRRSAYAAFIASMVAFVFVLNKQEIKSLLKVLVPTMAFIVVYSAVFWNSTSKLGSPVQMIKSGIFQDKKDDGEHYSSNLYREIEKYDLAVTSRGSPIFGIGFGKKYLQPMPLVPIPFPLRDWIPHDEILWLIVKMGGLGFFIFWLFIDAVLFEAASIIRMLKDPFLRAVCFLVIASLVGQMVVSYYDLQLTFYRNMIFLGTLCGLLPALRELAPKPENESETLRVINRNDAFA